MTLAGASIRAADSPPQPGPADFNLPPIVEVAGFGITKPMVLVVLSAVIAFGVLYAMSRRAAVVPGRLQFAGEAVYGFVRNGIARENIGAPDYHRYVPYLFTIFAFVLVNNYYGMIPFFQFPTMSRIGYPLALALIAWVVYNAAGIGRHGFLGYLKLQTLPPGLPAWIVPIIVPLEFLSNILLRPLTLTLRLFATMFAGHLLLILFALGGEYLLLHSENALAIPGGILSFVMFIAISFLELLIMFLQAYVFTLLTAMYIGLALADEH
ncbi:F0F1 ATP synthase subunit A [Nocardioides sp. CFH 31398]|uniref:F0F1 ATP synthase subunit A n=1 Tax=Nocardioides sp. CFH 31398 TaxID=2919579 RepID=UPI001F066634|nr:F0F1 ATP synthase subunit A [Nocardioides sp. CFH 31398]MCH1868872.1 F0F1 ATP synthase subunit A [Nocardioides sp. CFH 31398]